MPLTPRSRGSLHREGRSADQLNLSRRAGILVSGLTVHDDRKNMTPFSLAADELIRQGAATREPHLAICLFLTEAARVLGAHQVSFVGGMILPRPDISSALKESKRKKSPEVGTLISPGTNAIKLGDYCLILRACIAI